LGAAPAPSSKCPLIFIKEKPALSIFQIVTRADLLSESPAVTAWPATQRFLAQEIRPVLWILPIEWPVFVNS
jgi:hypothetical protein